MKKYSGIIFDLDGTLINSLEDIADSVNQTLQEYGYPTHPYNQYRFLVGNGFRSLMTQSLPEDQRDEATVARCHARGMEIYAERCIHKSHLYDGIAEWLDDLSLRGIKRAILSNKPHALTEKTTGALLNRWDFEVILGLSDRFPSKPNPTSALYIAQTMGLDPSEIVYVGDSNVDMKTAQAAGFYAVGVSWGFRPRTELEESGADRIIDHPSEWMAR